jgi:hypothetical protein
MSGRPPYIDDDDDDDDNDDDDDDDDDNGSDDEGVDLTWLVGGISSFRYTVGFLVNV